MLFRLRAPTRACHAFDFWPHASSTSRPNPLSRNHELRRPSRWSSSSPLAPSATSAAASTSSSSAAVPPPASTTPPQLLLSTPERPLILAFNLSLHELEALRSTGLGWQVVAVDEEEAKRGWLLDVAAGSVTLAAESGNENAPRSRPSPSLSVRATLLVLPRGCSANDGASEGLASYPSAVDEALMEAGCALCVTGVGVRVGVEDEKKKKKKKNSEEQPQQQQRLSDALERLGRAHAAASGIWRPLPRLNGDEKVPRGATLAMAAFLDAAPWDDCADSDGDDDDDGGESDENDVEEDENQEFDLSGLAVIDGLLSQQEASDLLLYLTGGDPSSPAEGEKWQRGAVVDHDGGDREEEEASASSSSSPSSAPPPSSWGATPQFIDSLLSSPPPQLLALCSRLRALYSEEFSEVLLCPGNDEMSPGLTPLVLNAITPEDAPLLSPHVDADPLRSDPDGAWARAFGLYRNRERGEEGGRGQTLPLLATALLYLQDWPLEEAAETLFFDAEEAGLGLAVRPRAGRVVVSEQDVVHRIVPPKKLKKSSPPRYSLVLKLALIPKEVGEEKYHQRRAASTSVVLPAWRPGALRLGTAAAKWPLPLA